MGQKVIPTSLRLYKTQNWYSKWTSEKLEYSDLLHFDLEIRKYFENIYNYKNIKILNLYVKKISKNINIYIYIYQPSKKNFYNVPYNKIVNNLNSYYKNHNIKLFVKNYSKREFFEFKIRLKKIFNFMKKKKKINKEIRKMIYNFSYALYTKKISMMTFFMKQMLQRKKSHKKQMKNINNTLKKFYKLFSNFIGYRLQFKGRLNGSKRKKKLIYQEGKVPLNSLKYNIKYHFNEFKTPTGICSIKLWIFLKKKDYAISK